MKKFLRKFRYGEKGFTLIELLVVVAILGVLAAAHDRSAGREGLSLDGGSPLRHPHLDPRLQGLDDGPGGPGSPGKEPRHLRLVEGGLRHRLGCPRLRGAGDGLGPHALDVECKGQAPGGHARPRD